MDSCSMVGATGSYQFKFNHSKTKDMGIRKFITSPTFRVGEHDWVIQYYPQGDDKDSGGKYVSVYLELQSESAGVTSNYGFALLDKQGIVSLTSLKDFRYTFTSHDSWGMSCFLRRTTLEEKYIKDDCFVLSVSVTIADDQAGLHNEPLSILLGHSVEGTQIIHNNKFLHNRLQKFREDNKQTDVSFIVDGVNFVAHRLILAAHSPVFEAELSGLMVESNLDCITINEMIPSQFKAMLDFMYSGSLPVDHELSDDEEVLFYQNMLVAADRYAVENLKFMCEHKLVDSISLENAISLLELAEKHNCSELKEECLNFLVAKDNLVSLLLTEGYVKLIQNYPSLLAEIKELVGK